jgi:hypothetical protein
MHVTRCNIVAGPCPNRPVVVFVASMSIADPACWEHATGDYVRSQLLAGRGKLQPFTPDQRAAIAVAWEPEPGPTERDIQLAEVRSLLHATFCNAGVVPGGDLFGEHDKLAEAVLKALRSDKDYGRADK